VLRATGSTVVPEGCPPDPAGALTFRLIDA
jgi:hypothetical protein